MFADLTPGAILLDQLVEVFTFITGHIAGVLTMFTDNILLVLLLGLMVAGAIFSFAMRLIYRS